MRCVKRMWEGSSITDLPHSKARMSLMTGVYRELETSVWCCVSQRLVLRIADKPLIYNTSPTHRSSSTPLIVETSKKLLNVSVMNGKVPLNDCGLKRWGSQGKGIVWKRKSCWTYAISMVIQSNSKRKLLPRLDRVPNTKFNHTLNNLQTTNNILFQV